MLIMQRRVGTGSTIPWNISTASYSGNSFDISNEDSFIGGLAFKDDGTKMYAVGWQTSTVYQYSLSVPWNVSTASYDSVSRSVDDTIESEIPRGLTFASTGSKLYVTDFGGDQILQYGLSTSWDLSTASFEKSLDVSSLGTTPMGAHISANGTKLYILERNSQTVHQWALAVPYDVGSTSTTTTFDVSNEETVPREIFINPDGSKMFLLGGNANAVLQYTLGTLENISTASYDGISVNVSSTTSTETALTFGDGGTKFYVVGLGNVEVSQYNL